MLPNTGCLSIPIRGRGAVPTRENDVTTQMREDSVAGPLLSTLMAMLGGGAVLGALFALLLGAV
jgi:hypothetical protein